MMNKEIKNLLKTRGYTMNGRIAYKHYHAEDGDTIAIHVSQVGNVLHANIHEVSHGIRRDHYRCVESVTCDLAEDVLNFIIKVEQRAEQHLAHLNDIHSQWTVSLPLNWPQMNHEPLEHV